MTREGGPPEGTGGVEAWEANGAADHLLDRLEGDGWRSLQALTAVERAARLGAAGARFLDPEDALTREAVARIPGDALLSTEGAREVLRGMARDWTGDRLQAALTSDFPDPVVLDGFRPGPEGDAVRALPPRLLVQVGAGNVPGTGATALLRGLLVGAPTLLKPGTGDGVLPVLMARAIQEVSPELAPALAVTPWRGGGGGLLEERALARAERVVVYGGWGTIRSIRERVPPGVSVVEYGHRVSVGVVTRSALSAVSAATLAQDAAAAVSAYEQRGCVSPHAIWVEMGGQVEPVRWAELLGEALAARSRRIPPLPDPGALATVRQVRDAAELREAAGRGNRVLGGPSEGWMVLFEPEPRLELSCLGRTVRVHPVEDASAVPALLRPVRGLLQSCAVAGEEPDRRRVAAGLAEAGVTRITTFRRLAWPPAWWHHDGEGPLRALVRWVGLEGVGDA